MKRGHVVIKMRNSKPKNMKNEGQLARGGWGVIWGTIKQKKKKRQFVIYNLSLDMISIFLSERQQRK